MKASESAVAFDILFMIDDVFLLQIRSFVGLLRIL